jgi:hypothetical protein
MDSDKLEDVEGEGGTGKGDGTSPTEISTAARDLEGVKTRSY